MVGEFDYNDNFEFNSVYEYGGRNYSTQIMVVSFMISMSILIMNLLIAVAVNNTENLAERSRMIFAQRKILHLLGARKIFLIFKPYLKCLALVTYWIPFVKGITSVPDSIEDIKVSTYFLK